MTSAVTGRHSNQLNYRAKKKKVPKMVGDNRIELLTSAELIAHKMVTHHGIEP